MADRPTTHDEEGSKGGERSVIMWAIASAFLLVMLILVGSGHIGSKRVAESAPQPNTESPATSGAQEPKQ